MKMRFILGDSSDVTLKKNTEDKREINSMRETTSAHQKKTKRTYLKLRTTYINHETTVGYHIDHSILFATN